MSVSLSIRWANELYEEVLLAHQQTAIRWGDEAALLGLKVYNSSFPLFIEPSNIDDFIGDFRLLRNAEAQRVLPPDVMSLTGRIDGVIEALEN